MAWACALEICWVMDLISRRDGEISWGRGRGGWHMGQGGYFFTLSPNEPLSVASLHLVFQVPGHQAHFYFFLNIQQVAPKTTEDEF